MFVLLVFMLDLYSLSFCDIGKVGLLSVGLILGYFVWYEIKCCY